MPIKVPGIIIISLIQLIITIIVFIENKLGYRSIHLFYSLY